MCGDGKAVREYGVAPYQMSGSDESSQDPKEKEKME
jgi:hypothetical protein